MASPLPRTPALPPPHPYGHRGSSAHRTGHPATTWRSPGPRGSSGLGFMRILRDTQGPSSVGRSSLVRLCGHVSGSCDRALEAEGPDPFLRRPQPCLLCWKESSLGHWPPLNKLTGSRACHLSLSPGCTCGPPRSLTVPPSTGGGEVSCLREPSGYAQGELLAWGEQTGAGGTREARGPRASSHEQLALSTLGDS